MQNKRFIEKNEKVIAARPAINNGFIPTEFIQIVNFEHTKDQGSRIKGTTDHIFSPQEELKKMEFIFLNTINEILKQTTLMRKKTLAKYPSLRNKLISNINTSEYFFCDIRGTLFSEQMFFFSTLPKLEKIARKYPKEITFTFASMFVLAKDLKSYMNLAISGHCGPQTGLVLTPKHNKVISAFEYQKGDDDPFTKLPFSKPPQNGKLHGYDISNCYAYSSPHIKGRKYLTGIDICVDNEFLIGEKALMERLLKEKNCIPIYKLCSNYLDFDIKDPDMIRVFNNNIVIQADPRSGGAYLNGKKIPVQIEGSIKGVSGAKKETFNVEVFKPICSGKAI